MVRRKRPQICNCTPGNLGARSSVLRGGRISEIENRFGERKLQYDLALIVSHFEDRIQEAHLYALGFQQFSDHCPRNFPCAVGIAQFFAFGIGYQLIADTCVEKVPRHESKSTSVEGSG